MWRKLLALACIVLATGCGDGADDAASPGGPFLGTWATTSATTSVFDCPFKADQQNVPVTYTVAKGDGADLKITSSLAPDCALKANVVGTRATVLVNQSCQRQDAKYKDTYTYATTSVFDMPPGGAATIKLEATFKRATIDGLDTGYECGFTEESPVTKK